MGTAQLLGHRRRCLSSAAFPLLPFLQPKISDTLNRVCALCCTGEAISLHREEQQHRGCSVLAVEALWAEHIDHTSVPWQEHSPLSATGGNPCV